MSLAQHAIFCTKTKLCLLAVLIIVITIILAASLSDEDEELEESLKYANEKLNFPTSYLAVRALDSYTGTTMSFETGGQQIGHTEKCISCETTWAIYLLNKEDEIAVIMKKKSWTWADMYTIEEQWKINATSYSIEYSWSGSGISKDIYVIKNSNGDEIARTDRFPLAFGKTLTLNDSERNSTLGVIERPAFELFSTWEISVNKTEPVPTYMYGVLATITTLKEVDDDDDE